MRFCQKNKQLENKIRIELAFYCKVNLLFRLNVFKVYKMLSYGLTPQIVLLIYFLSPRVFHVQLNKYSKTRI